MRELLLFEKIHTPEQNIYDCTSYLRVLNFAMSRCSVESTRRFDGGKRMDGCAVCKVRTNIKRMHRSSTVGGKRLIIMTS